MKYSKYGPSKHDALEALNTHHYSKISSWEEVEVGFAQGRRTSCHSFLFLDKKKRIAAANRQRKIKAVQAQLKSIAVAAASSKLLRRTVDDSLIILPIDFYTLIQ